MGTSHPLGVLALAKALLGPGGVRSLPEPRSEALHAPCSAYLAEAYLRGLDEQRVELLTSRMRAAAALGGTVRLLASAGLPGDDSLLSIFWASSPEAVAAAVRQAELSADRIVPVVWRIGER